MAEERKLVTILFADVTGSTALGELLDPEDIRALMSRYYQHARQTIELYGGRLEKFIGDAIMAVFGLPQAYGDDTERALSAALALRNAVASDTVLATTFTLRIGVNTGEVITTSDPVASDFLVTGDAVNVAARLQQHAEPGEIMVGERAMQATRNAFLFTEPRQVEARGKRHPLLMYPLKEVRSIRKVERPPLVGRRQDLLQLTLLKERILEERRPQVATIVAPAGIGKSRLLEEFLKDLPQQTLHILKTRCLPYGQALTYWPLRSLLNDLLGETASKTALINIFQQGGYSPLQAEDQADCVLTLFGMEGSNTQNRECSFAAWRLLIELCSQQRAQVIVFEDLHWAGDGLLDMLEYIMHLPINAPLFLIALCRPELFDARPTWGGGMQNTTTLTLQPLSCTQTEELIKHLNKQFPTSLRDQIVKRSGGNPFFTLELVRGLNECTISQVTQIDALPDNVHAAILARLDRLTPIERAVLRVASVAPRQFRPAMLIAIIKEYTPSEIDQALDGLLARELIQPYEGGCFLFQHILIHDVAYGIIARRERIHIHSKMAAWLEQYALDRRNEYIDLIAYHYREAIALARQAAIPLELPVDINKAILALKQAGEQASRIGSFAEAQEYLQSAIDIASDDKKGMLYEHLGDCVAWGSIAIAAYREAWKRWQTLNQHISDPINNKQETISLIGARLLRKLLICATRGYEEDRLPDEEFFALRADAQRLVKEANDEDELWHVSIIDLFASSEIIQQLGHTREDMEHTALAAAEHFKQKGNWTAFSTALDAHASVCIKFENYVGALHSSQLRLTAPELPAVERNDALNMISKAHVYMGNYDQCIAFEEEVFKQNNGQSRNYFSTHVSQAIFAGYISGNWVAVDKFAIDLDYAWEQLQRGISEGTKKTVFSMHGGYIAMLYKAMACDDTATADMIIRILNHKSMNISTIDRSLINAIRMDNPHATSLDLIHISEKLSLYAMFFYSERNMIIPGELYRRAMAHCYTGNALYRCSEIAQALIADDNEQLASAIDTAEEHQLIVHAARMRIVLAQRTGEYTQLERARPVLEKLSDRQFLRRLDEVAATMKQPSENC